jgi:hypothetical protein
MKKYIDYLFWKRTWFRGIFILLGIPSFIIIYLMVKYDFNNETARGVGIAVYLLLFILGLLDSNNIDSPPAPPVPKFWRYLFVNTETTCGKLRAHKYNKGEKQTYYTGTGKFIGGEQISQGYYYYKYTCDRCKDYFLTDSHMM